MDKVNYLEEIAKISHLLSLEVLKDIDKRICDWLAGGGKETDEYIGQQLRYAQNVLNYSK